jgi:hypothetical protein
MKAYLLAEVNQFCNSQLHEDATLLLIAAQTTSRERSAPSDILERESLSQTTTR